jgi:hypothetical protein
VALSFVAKLRTLWKEAIGCLDQNESPGDGLCQLDKFETEPLWYMFNDMEQRHKLNVLIRDRADDFIEVFQEISGDKCVVGSLPDGFV